MLAAPLERLNGPGLHAPGIAPFTGELPLPVSGWTCLGMARLAQHCTTHDPSPDGAAG